MTSKKKTAIGTPNERIWEIDALRGLLITAILIAHLWFAFRHFFIDGGFQVNLTEQFAFAERLASFFEVGAVGDYPIYLLPFVLFAKAWDFLFDVYFGVFCMFVLSGISVNFSRNRFKTALRLVCGAAFVSLFTKLLAIYTGDEHQFIRFGALHCYAACHLIHYYFLENKSDRTLLVVAAVSMILGYYLQLFPVFSENALLVPFGIYERGAIVRDYHPIFPKLGWFLIGTVLGRHLYEEKKSLFPMQTHREWHKPLRFMGRHSGLIYCGHMVVYAIVFCGIGYLFDLY